MKIALKFFDKLEDKIRISLSRKPILYAFIGGIGIVLFWRGVWHTNDFIVESFVSAVNLNQSTDIKTLVWWDGPLSLLIGSILLLATGVMVSSFIGNEIVISGLKGEKKIVEKTESEIKNETESLKDIHQEMQNVSDELKKIEREIQNKK